MSYKWKNTLIVRGCFFVDCKKEFHFSLLAGDTFLLYYLKDTLTLILVKRKRRHSMLKAISSSLILILVSFIIANSIHAQVIHETREGDTLSRIALSYHTPIESIATLNGLNKKAKLVIGQAIIIPGSSYVVQSGDTISGIAKRHAITIPSLITENRLKSNLIFLGQKLKIPVPPKQAIWTGTYYIPKDKNTNNQMLEYYKKTLSSVFVFDYHPNEKGQLIEVKENDSNKIAWRKNLSPYATLTNISGKGFDPDLIHLLLSNSGLRRALINNIYSMLDSHDYKGVVIDFEMVNTEDREHLNQFISQLAAKLHPAKMEVLMAMPPMTGDKIPTFYGGYDYKTLGKYLDKMFLMTYNWHWPGGPSGPIAPIHEIRPVLNYAVSVVPRSKLMLGIPQYAYDWPITDGNKKGIAYSTQNAINKYLKYESQIHYDERAAAPWFRYKDELGILHEVWFEDPRSLLAKFHLIKEYQLGGMGCWHLGTSMPQTEELIVGEFNIK